MAYSSLTYRNRLEIFNMFDFIIRQTQYYTDRAAKLNWCNFVVSRFVTPIGIDGKTGRVVRSYEMELGYVDYENLITHGTFGTEKVKITNS